MWTALRRPGAPRCPHPRRRDRVHGARPTSTPATAGMRFAAAATGGADPGVALGPSFFAKEVKLKLFEHILEAIDGSDHSRQMLPTSIEVARKLEVPSSFSTSTNAIRGAGQLIRWRARKTRLAWLPVWSRLLRDAGFEASSEVRHIVTGHVAKATMTPRLTSTSTSASWVARSIRPPGSASGQRGPQGLQMARVPVLVDRSVARRAPVRSA